MRRSLGALAMVLALFGAAAGARAEESSAPAIPVLVQVDRLAPMLLFGDSPGEAARAYVGSLGKERVFPGSQEALEAWARSRSARPAATSLAKLRAGNKPIIGVQLNSGNSVLGSRHLPPRLRAVVRGIREAGGQPLLLPPAYDESKVSELLGAVDHLVLPGGDDVHPNHYGEGVTFANKHQLNERRDAYEKTIILRARKRGVPIVAICRGCQMLNVASGGTLHQDINRDGVTTKKHTGSADGRNNHDVKVVPQSRMARTFGATLVKNVASVHHAAVKTPGMGFVVVGRSPDGVVEAIESLDGKARGYQFHPEMDPAHSKVVFRDVVAEAKKSATYRARHEAGGSRLLRTRKSGTRRFQSRRRDALKRVRSRQKARRARAGRR